ncbi:uncharacterized protein L969DRAFT_20841, partial [Mixia osmundae IAM 14324]|uniref:uncharacterized protein n=1 Tax=Mixia osmundae (strain CBS 9802 / IAM 14324 / JCM 22182 / KY 12970) TaxID=764103 RepID=UPI0004A55428
DVRRGGREPRGRRWRWRERCWLTRSIGRSRPKGRWCRRCCWHCGWRRWRSRWCWNFRRRPRRLRHWPDWRRCWCDQHWRRRRCHLDSSTSCLLCIWLY